MPFDDDELQDQNQLDDDRRRKLLSLIVGSAIKPFRRDAPGPAASPSVGLGRQNDTPWSEEIPGVGGTSANLPILGRPRIPAAGTTPVTPPTFPTADAQPNLFGASARPARPSGPPQREDFQARPELGGWRKYLGLGLASLTPADLRGPLTERILHGQRDDAERKYEQAEKDYESRQQDEERAARIANIQSEIKTRENPKPEKPENLDREAYDFYVAGGMTPAEARKQVLKDAAETKPEKPDTAVEEQQRWERIETDMLLGKTVSKQDKAWHDSLSEYRTLGPALTANIKAGEQGTARSDKSYQFHAGRIDALRKPIEDRAERIARVEDTLAQGTPQADALIAPELLSVMAGGAGSGVRQNEAELARIVGGRTNWETLKAKVDAWQLDPSKGFALTPAQREQTRALFSTVKDRVSRKMQAIDEESQNLLNTDDPKEHRRIYQRLQKRLGDIDTGKGGQTTGGAADGPPNANIPSGWQWIQQDGKWGITDGKSFRPYQGQ
jgi:hypothetical protein